MVDQARAQGLLSAEHFTVDSTLIEDWASDKSFQRKDVDRKTPPDDPGNPSVDFHGERRRNETHQGWPRPGSSRPVYGYGGGRSQQSCR